MEMREEAVNVCVHLCEFACVCGGGAHMHTSASVLHTHLFCADANDFFAVS